jgi:hypothetical protein
VLREIEAIDVELQRMSVLVRTRPEFPSGISGEAVQAAQPTPA